MCKFSHTHGQYKAECTPRKALPWVVTKAETGEIVSPVDHPEVFRRTVAAAQAELMQVRHDIMRPVTEMAI